MLVYFPAVQTCLKHLQTEKQISSVPVSPFIRTSYKIFSTNWKSSLTLWIKKKGKLCNISALINCNWICRKMFTLLSWCCISHVKSFTFATILFAKGMMFLNSYCYLGQRTSAAFTPSPPINGFISYWLLYRKTCFNFIFICFGHNSKYILLPLQITFQFIFS